MKRQRTLDRQAQLHKTITKLEDYPLDLKTYFKANANKKVWYWLKDRQIDH